MNWFFLRLGGLLLLACLCLLPALSRAASFTATGSLNAGRFSHSATLLPNGKVLIAGGAISDWSTTGSYLNSAELYDPATGSFTVTGNMTARRSQHTATLLKNGKVLIVGGYIGFANRNLSSAELYDPDTGTFAPTGDMGWGRAGHTATLLPDGRVLIVGGNDGYGYSVNHAQIYDPDFGTFGAPIYLANFHEYHSATSLPDGRVFIAGGYSRGTDLYHPSSLSFSSSADLETAFSYHTATLLPDGRVLLVGGGLWQLAEVYDPGTETFSSTGLPSAVRYNHTATPLPGGRVLVAGGHSKYSVYDGATLPQAGVELYDPATGSFTATHFGMTTVRANHTATLLPGGKVLLVGGMDGTSAPLASAELCDPVPDPPPPTIAGAPPTGGTVGSAYSFVPTSSDATSFTLTGTLPLGLVFDAATGRVSGIPMVAGTYGNLSISAVNYMGTTALPVFSIKVITVPGAPTGVTALAGPGQAVVSFSPPASDGGSPITSYTVTSTPGGLSATGAAGPLTVTGLSSGTSYSFSVTARNAAGTGLASSPSNALLPLSPTVGNVVTLAGRGFGGVFLYGPSGVALDGDGNLYLADAGNSRVLKLAAGSGRATVVAGNGDWGYSGDNGPATAASLDIPTGLAVDKEGNLYIADNRNHRIRKVAAGTGIITTVAGNGVNGYSGDGGAATAASISNCIGLALDGSGNLYLADSGNHRVRKVASGIITTVAGNGTEGYAGDGGAAAAASLDFPAGVAFDAGGNLYIADVKNNRIRMVSATTQAISTVAGNGVAGFSGDGGFPLDASLAWPAGLAFDAAGSLYIADYSNNRIRMVSASTGRIVTVAGNGAADFSGDGGPALGAAFNGPMSLQVDGVGNIFVMDSQNDSLREVIQSLAPYPARAPGAPVAPSAQAGEREAVVSFLPPALTGGSPVTLYTVTATPGNIAATGSSSPITVTGLDNATAYSFSVAAQNAVGTGPAATAANLNRLSVTLSGSGAGAVNSVPSGIHCTGGTCFGNFSPQESFVLTASAAAGSRFLGWQGGNCSGSGTCSVSLAPLNQSLTALFDTLAYVRFAGGAKYFGSLTAACLDAGSSAVIEARGITFVENLTLAEPKTVTLRGGYDPGFSVPSGYTRLQGTLTVSQGRLVADRLVIN